MEIEVQHPRCPYCREAVRPDDAKTPCQGCMGWSHAACWEELGECAACARPRKPAPAAGLPDRAPPTERPPAAWGISAQPGRCLLLVGLLLAPPGGALVGWVLA